MINEPDKQTMKISRYLIIILILSSCSKKESERTSHLDSLNRDKYFNTEVLTGSYQDLYGTWKAFNVFGGWSGNSEPDFDYLEIKQFGIYGLVRNDTLFEYGKISPDTFDIKPYFPGYQVRLEPDSLSGIYPFFGSNRYFDLPGKDTLAIYDGLYDGVTYSFKRVK
jgi:hypothetical protein